MWADGVAASLFGTKDKDQEETRGAEMVPIAAHIILLKSSPAHC